jgi:hypothetical protein
MGATHPKSGDPTRNAVEVGWQTERSRGRENHRQAICRHGPGEPAGRVDARRDSGHSRRGCGSGVGIFGPVEASNQVGSLTNEGTARGTPTFARRGGRFWAVGRTDGDRRRGHLFGARRRSARPTVPVSAQPTRRIRGGGGGESRCVAFLGSVGGSPRRVNVASACNRDIYLCAPVRVPS